MDLDADDLLEDVDETFDTSEVKSVMELAMRMAEIVRSTSEWHRRMSSKKLSQNGKCINYEALIPGVKVYFYKPPSIQEVEKRSQGQALGPLHGSGNNFKSRWNQIFRHPIHG
jgi:hypothetical protein